MSTASVLTPRQSAAANTSAAASASLPADLSDVNAVIDDLIRDLNDVSEVVPLKSLRNSYHSIIRHRYTTNQTIKQTIKSLTANIAAANCALTETSAADLTAESVQLKAQFAQLKAHVDALKQNERTLQARVDTTEANAREWAHQMKAIDVRRQKDSADLSRQVQMFRLLSNIVWQRGLTDERSLSGVFNFASKIQPFHYVVSDGVTNGTELDGYTLVNKPADIADRLWDIINQNNDVNIPSTISSR